MSDGSCEAECTISNCQMCSAPNTCSLCMANYTVNSTGACELQCCEPVNGVCVESAYCRKCTEICKDCPDGQVLKESQCVGNDAAVSGVVRMASAATAGSSLLALLSNVGS